MPRYTSEGMQAVHAITPALAAEIFARRYSARAHGGRRLSADIKLVALARKTGWIYDAKIWRGLEYLETHRFTVWTG